MAFIDVEIARMIQKEKKKEKEEQEKQKKVEDDASIDEQALIESIQKGECTLFDRTYYFQSYSILGDRVQVYLPSEDITIRIDATTGFQTLNMDMGFSSNFILSDILEEFEPLSFYKNNMVKNMKPSGIQFKWVEEGSILNKGIKILYLDFINVTGLGSVHNNIWFIMTPYGRLQCTLNYDHEDDKYWNHMMRALIKLIEIK